MGVVLAFQLGNGITDRFKLDHAAHRPRVGFALGTLLTAALASKLALLMVASRFEMTHTCETAGSVFACLVVLFGLLNLFNRP